MTKKKSLAWQNCSEEQLSTHLTEWLSGFAPENTVVFLEGDMGAGKSTFVRACLKALSPKSRSAGSPTFSLVNEYRADQGYTIYHIDLYRLKDENELQDSGIESQIEEPGALVFVEWASLFPDYFSYWWDASRKKMKTVIQVRIENTDDPAKRSIHIRS